MNLRTATMDDYAAICRLIEQVDRHHVGILPEVFQPFAGPPRPREVIASYGEAPDADYLLAEDEGQVVGFLNLRKAKYPGHPMFRPHEYAAIENLVVDEAHRRRGVATALFQEAVAWAEARGLAAIELTVWAANAAALAFYEGQGFQPLTHRMELRLGGAGME